MEFSYARAREVFFIFIATIATGYNNPLKDRKIYQWQ